MTTTNAGQAEIKLCCASFYQSDVVRLLLGDVYHPGGLELTAHLGEMLGLGPTDRVLDVACGRGTSAVHLAERFGCHVTGLDYGAENVDAARALAIERGVADRALYQTGDAEELPFAGGSFDAVISECSFCTFPDKGRAASEMARVLRLGGRLGLTDMTVYGTLPEDLLGLLGWVACVAGAGTLEDYVATLQAAGFAEFVVEDQRDALLDLATHVRRKLLGVELAAKLGKIDLGELDLDEGKRLVQRAARLIEDGVVGYTLIAAERRERPAAQRGPRLPRKPGHKVRTAARHRQCIEIGSYPAFQPQTDSKG